MKKHLLAALVFSLFFTSKLSAQNSRQTLTVVSWNIEWFGSTTQAPNDDNLQEENVRKILRYLDADVYGLVEVVDTMRLRRVVDSLGPNFDYVISDYCSNSATGTGSAWLSGQKLAFVYNRTVFSNVKTAGLLRNSTSAYTNFASGRFPYLLNADATVNGVTKNINFILLHGKAGSAPTDYDKRAFGARELKDSLDAYYSTSMNILLGDFNDALNRTICTSCTTTLSSYDAIVKDSTDNDHYKSITMPLAVAGLSSMTNFPNVIDNHVISDEMERFYIPGSAAIRKDITTPVPDFLNGATSDHYPVISQYNLTGVVTGLPMVPATAIGVTAYPNPFINTVTITFAKAVTNVQLQITDAKGQLIQTQSFQRLNAGTQIKPSLPLLSPGVYYINIKAGGQQTVLKLIHL